MILHLDPAAPFWLKATAQAALALHIAGASAALISGPAAMIFRKGGRLHRLSGDVFFVAMLTMTGIGAVVAPMMNDVFSSVGGAFGFYLTATGWAAVMRAPGRIGRFEPLALVFILGVGATVVIIAAQAMAEGGGIKGAPPQAPFVIAGICALAAAADISVILRGGLSGAPRLARHIWRICAALLVAALSFAAQPKAQPEALRGSPVFLIPAILILAGMIYWLVRIRIQRGGHSRGVAAGPLPAAV